MANDYKTVPSGFDGEAQFSRRIDWNLLKIFHVIATHNGVTRAATAMARKQPTVSLALRRLEEQLGVILCTRGPGGFALTDEGKLVADICSRMWGQIGELPKRIANISIDVRGQVNVLVISNLVDEKLDSAIEQFHGRHLLVEICINVVTWEIVGRTLLRNQADIGVAPAHQKNPRLKYEPLFLEYHRPYCGRRHPLWGQSFDNPRQLADQKFVLTGADEPDELTQYRLRYELGQHIAGVSEHLEEARRMAVLGVGICFLPEKFAGREVQRNRLHPLLPATKECTNAIYVITNPAAPRQVARDELVNLLLQN